MIVEGVNRVSVTPKAGQGAGGAHWRHHRSEASIHVSNVMVVDDETAGNPRSASVAKRVDKNRTDGTATPELGSPSIGSPAARTSRDN